MVFNVRCYKCGEDAVRLILGGRAILHARCHSCDSNLLAEVMALQEEVEARAADGAEEPANAGEMAPAATESAPPSPDQPPTTEISFSSPKDNDDAGLSTGS